jgi:hypothetical protein
MKRIRILGLCLMAACALGAVSMSASASAAHFGKCVAAKKANYTEGNCATVAMKNGVPDHKGHFEFEATGTCYPQKKANFTEGACATVAMKNGVPDHKGHFELSPDYTYASTGGIAELASAAGVIKCTASAGGGVVVSGTLTKAQTIFTGCETKGKKCQNTANEGEIETFELDGNLTEPTSGDAQLVISGTFEGKYEAEFGCTEVAAIRVSGTVGGEQSPTNVTSHTNTLLFHEAVEQNLKAEFGPPGWPAGETLTLPSEQRAEITNTSASEAEIHIP